VPHEQPELIERRRRLVTWYGGGPSAPLSPPRGGLLLPLLMIVLGVIAYELVDRDRAGTPFFIAAPLVAAPFCSGKGTTATGLASALTLSILHVQDVRDITRILTVATVSLLAVGLNRLLRRSSEALASVRSIANVAQFAVLPVPPARIGGLHIAARYEAAQTDALIGGDLYAVQDTPHGIRFLVGDVRGKGMDALGTVVVVIGAFREAAEQETTLEAVAERLERALHREHQRRRELSDREDFTTAALAEIPAADTGVLRIVNRGHPAPLLIEDGASRFIHPRVPALPLGIELGRWPDRAEEVPFPGGAQLLLYTDGLSEARDDSGAFFDPGEALSGRVFEGPEELLDSLVRDVERHTGGGAADDMALLAVQRLNGPD
jgi:serine phosphatase RsbU (regulator of sigma subunit)